MYVYVDVGGEVSLRDDDNFSAFSLVANVSRIKLLDVINPDTGIGIIADLDHAWIRESWLRSQGLIHGEEWTRQLDAMLAYAGSKGWTNSGAVRAHIVTSTVDVK
jgi:hypothetical protein